jgi:hypothetical protein
MTSGEILTRLTIWITILAYTVGAAAFALSRNRHRGDSVARVAWSVACLSLFAHVMSAFHFYHGWRQSAAYVETARQTNEMFGLNWGGGLYINYALLIFWIVDVAWWWLRGLDGYRRRPWPLVATWHGFLIFIIFNATVVFKTGFTRWAGLGLCLGLGIVWWWSVKDNSFRTPAQYSSTVAEE